jgi:beta-lactam-binding protein with PASTA domain
MAVATPHIIIFFMLVSMVVSLLLGMVTFFGLETGMIPQLRNRGVVNAFIEFQDPLQEWLI